MSELRRSDFRVSPACDLQAVCPLCGALLSGDPVDGSIGRHVAWHEALGVDGLQREVMNPLRKAPLAEAGKKSDVSEHSGLPSVR